MAATKNVLIEAGDDAAGYSEVINAVNALEVGGTKTTGYAPVVQADGTVDWASVGGGGGGGGLTWAVYTTGQTAENGKGYAMNTTSGALTVTLPASPSAGDLVGIKDAYGTSATNNITINPNGGNIEGDSSNVVIDVNGAAIELTYLDATRGWVQINTAMVAAGTVCNGRLTLESGVAVSTSDQTAKTTVYFTPYKGDLVGLYNGSTAWNVYDFTELSLSISSLTADTNYDIFLYNNAGTLTLESTAWTNDSTRATALVEQNGVYVKSGATTRRYLGTIRITGTTGQCEDSKLKRFVYNYYNRVQRYCWTYNTTGNFTYSGASWREYNNGTGQLRGHFVVGVVEDIINLIHSGNAVTSVTGFVGTTLNQIVDSSTGVFNTYSNIGLYYGPWGYQTQNPALGYNYITQLHRSDGSNNLTVYGSDSNSGKAIILC